LDAADFPIQAVAIADNHLPDMLMRLINASLIFGAVLLSMLDIEPISAMRQYFATLFAGWAILHTVKLYHSQTWRLEFVSLPPNWVRLFHYAATFFLIAAAVYYWIFPTTQFMTFAALIMLISISLVFIKLGITPALKSTRVIAKRC
jgi:hypothetical protein